MNELDKKIKSTTDKIREFGLQGCRQEFQNLYLFTLNHIQDLSNLALFQLSGTLYSIMAFEKIPSLSRVSNIAYYCLTRGTYALQPAGYLNIIEENWMFSRAERAKLLLNGGLKLIVDRLYLFEDNNHQQVHDFSILGDILKLKQLNFSSNENWWRNALEDCAWIRNSYSQFSESEIINLSDHYHQIIAKRVYLDLQNYVESL